ncbi:Fe-S metabolism protein SufE [Nibricoccus aquaticus]|uniref:Fe-S metabolism protein SufE n=1 Tax=Nibricoccus aquaticus TaxID=2576891 RepID=A0A290Q4U6_9BACT|nr:SufE family protein [Nibricoccus aquaticus]ATC63443.1 Fe-S metabolism protein SufE [Nibricoccus aquaticus]
MTLAEKQRALIDDLSVVDDRYERLSLVVDRSRRSAYTLPASEKTDATRVTGCISPVWLTGELHDDGLSLRFDAESPMVRALVSLLVELYDGATPAEIVTTEPILFDELGLSRDLSPTRRNGLTAVRARIKLLAEKHLAP